MTENEFMNIAIGDKIMITNHGRNKGKMGIVKEIRYNNDEPIIVYLEPIDCTFQFCDDYDRWKNKDGLYGWNRFGINYPKKPVDKKFYIPGMFEGNGVSWSTDNFTSKELVIVEKFLKEFNEKATGLTMNGISILENYY